MIKLQSYVCGAWQDGTGTPRELYNPSTEAVMAQADSTGLDFAAALAHAREQGVPGLLELGFAGRAEILGKLSKLLREAREELIELSISNGGNTRGDAKFDLDGCTGTLHAYASLGTELGEGNALADGPGVQLGRSPRYWGQHHWVTRPGVAVHINAFNFPAWGMGEKLAQALLAGVPVITKPGTPTALLAWRIAQLIVDSGLLPAGAFQFVCGSTGDLLERLEPMDALSFTGSSGTGAMLKGTPNLVQKNVRVSLEADSLNSAIIGPDVAEGEECWDLLLRNLVTDITQKAGQKCTAVRRILVPEGLVDALQGELAARLEKTRVGNPVDEEVRMGPVASSQQFKDVRAGIDNLAAVCDKVCGGSEPIREQGYFVGPTLFRARDARADVIHDAEVFGPCATLIPYSGEVAEAVALANRGRGSLVASLYTDEIDWGRDVTLGISPWHGRIWWGAAKVADHAFPPGGVLPLSCHGGPGRAGGGEELGGLRGLEFYMQRSAVQGFQGFLTRHLPAASQA